MHKPKEHDYINEPCTANGYTIVKKETANGIVIRSQCECGYINGRSLKQSDFDLNKLPFADLDKYLEREFNIELFYENRRNQAEKERQARNEEIRSNNNAFWEEYKEYLNTDKWKIKRVRVLQRDKNLCQACLTSPANQVHHLTYAHVFDEPLFDLISVCARCHNKITEMDRERRLL